MLRILSRVAMWLVGVAVRINWKQAEAWLIKQILFLIHKDLEQINARFEATRKSAEVIKTKAEELNNLEVNK